MLESLTLDKESFRRAPPFAESSAVGKESFAKVLPLSRAGAQQRVSLPSVRRLAPDKAPDTGRRSCLRLCAPQDQINVQREKTS